MANQVVWFEVIGQDGEAERKFYADMFGWSYDQPEGMDYGMVHPSQAGIGGGIGTGQEGSPSYQTFYVSVDDVEEALQKAESLGGSRMMGPMDIPQGGTIGMFTDPHGHMVGVVAGFGDGAG